MARSSLFYLFVVTISHISAQLPGNITILVAEWKPTKIVVINTTSKREQELTTSGKPVAIDYDPRERTVYWTDIVDLTLKAAPINDLKLHRDIYTFEKGAKPDGLAVDSIARKMFYTDTGHDVIGVVDMDGSNHRALITRGLRNPRPIVLDEEKQKMYYADWGTTEICVANYDGTGIKKIFQNELQWPNGLALDKENGVLYWCDGGRDKIESGTINGTGRTVLLYERGSHYFDVFLYGEFLFFTDWRRPDVFYIPKTGGAPSKVGAQALQRPAGLHIIPDTIACDTGFYGSRCDLSCGHCQNKSCDAVDGNCLSGCLPGWNGSKCTEVCKEGSYGDECQSQCGQCQEGACDHVTGKCLSGCLPGWTGSNCKRVCSAGYYGQTCKLPCGHCRNIACHHVTGTCVSGCTAGWNGSLCTEVCSSGYFGEQCQSACPNCRSLECHHINGTCLSECLPGWKGEQCSHICEEGSYGDDCESGCGQCQNGTCHHVTGRCATGCLPGWTGNICKQESRISLNAVIGISVASGIVLVIGVGVVALLLRRRRRQNRTMSKPSEPKTYAMYDGQLFEDGVETTQPILDSDNDDPPES